MELRLATGHSQPHGFWRTLVPRVLGLGDWVTLTGRVPFEF